MIGAPASLTLTACDGASVRVLSRSEHRSLAEAGKAFDEFLRSGRDFAAEGYSSLEWGVFLTIRSRSGRIVRRMQVN